MSLLVFAMVLAEHRPLFAAKTNTPEHALELLRDCPDPLPEKRHQRFMESLNLLTAQHLDQVLSVASGTGPVSCRGLAMVEAGMIAARDPSVGAKVIRAVTPYLPHPDLWQAAIQAIVPIGSAANDQLMPLLDTQNEATWNALVIILQHINVSRLPKDSELISAEFPDTTEGRVRISAAWRRWWEEERQQGAPEKPNQKNAWFQHRGSPHNHRMQATACAVALGDKSTRRAGARRA